MKIWCLFSIDNNYDQPFNNLCAWWSKKPTLDQLANVLGIHNWGKPEIADQDVLLVVHIWSGASNQRLLGTNYRLEEVSEGKLDD